MRDGKYLNFPFNNPYYTIHYQLWFKHKDNNMIICDGLYRD